MRGDNIEVGRLADDRAVGAEGSEHLFRAKAAVFLVGDERKQEVAAQPAREGAGDEVEERPHRPIAPGLSERESGFPTPTGFWRMLWGR